MRKETAPLPNSIGYDSILRQIKKVCKSQISLNDKLENICKLLYDAVSYYDWVGFYLVDKIRQLTDELILGPFVGTPAEHVRIAFGEGVCGQVAEQKKTMTVQDVSQEKNYLSCNPEVKSEIVVPIFKNTEIVGEIDIDSHSVSPFTKDDKIFIEKVAKIVSNFIIQV